MTCYKETSFAGLEAPPLGGRSSRGGPAGVAAARKRKRRGPRARVSGRRRCGKRPRLGLASGEAGGDAGWREKRPEKAPGLPGTGGRPGPPALRLSRHISM
ncbi:UNVERIFIED_CONTAM: hypothetical protein K2H54_019871 [Gekko kuhli]